MPEIKNNKIKINNKNFKNRREEWGIHIIQITFIFSIVIIFASGILYKRSIYTLHLTDTLNIEYQIDSFLKIINNWHSH